MAASRRCTPKCTAASCIAAKIPAHRAAVAEHGIQPIDMVVVNLYAFEKTAAKPGVTLRRTDREHRHRRPLDDPLRRQEFSRCRRRHFARRLRRHRRRNVANSGGELSLETKWRLAQKAFATTAAYDSAIASTLERITPRTVSSSARRRRFPPTLRFSFQKTLDLRYGENPHQKAAMYSDGSDTGVANARQLQGKELSYNNIVDLQAAWDLAQEFERAGLRHHQAHQSLRHRDRQNSGRSLQARSRMRSRLGFRRRDRRQPSHRRRQPPKKWHKLFLEVIAAPSFDEAARDKFRRQEKSAPGRRSTSTLAAESGC